jgi:hypothetical protein
MGNYHEPFCISGGGSDPLADCNVGVSWSNTNCPLEIKLIPFSPGQRNLSNSLISIKGL